MIVTYNIVADFTTWRYRSVDLPQQYRCTAVSWFGKWSVTQVYKVLGHTTWWWADRPWRAIARAAAEPSQEQPPCKRRKGETDVKVSWPTQTTNRMRQSQRTDREIPWRYHDIVVKFHTILQYKKFPRFEPYTWGEIMLDCIYSTWCRH